MDLGSEPMTPTTSGPAASVRLMGPVVVERQGIEQRLEPGLTQRLLALLASSHGQTVPDERIISSLWGPTAPRNVAYSLRNTVFRLRALIGNDAVRRSAGGYNLDLQVVAVDVLDVPRLVGRAAQLVEEGDLETAQGYVDAALSMVRGPAYANLRNEAWAVLAADEADDAAAVAEELSAELSLRRGEGAAAIGNLRRNVAAHPLREGRWVQLITALAEDGRRTEAVRVASDARRLLAEHGMAPGPGLLEAERSALGISTPTVGQGPGSMVLEQLRLTPLVGRRTELHRLRSWRGSAWVRGPSGSGKTRFLAELAHEMGELGRRVLFVDANHLNLPPLVALTRELFAGLVAATHLSPALLSLLHPYSEGPVEGAERSEVRIAQIIDGLAEALLRLVDTQPVVLVVDNAEGLGTNAAYVIAEVALRIGDLLTVVMSHGASIPDDSYDAWQQVAGVPSTEVWMNPLSVDEITDLLATTSLAADERQTRALASRLEMTTSGNAGEIRQLVDVIARRSGEPADRLPEFDSVLDELLGGMGAASRRLVEYLAVAGGSIPWRTLHEAAGADSLAFDDEIHHLVESGIVAIRHTNEPALRLESFRHHVSASLSVVALRARRADLVAALRRTGESPRALATLLLDLAPDVDFEELDGTVELVFRHAAFTVDHDRVATVGDRYLAVAGFANDRPSSAGALMAILEALFARGDSERAGALREVLVARASHENNAELLADALLASGPADTGSVHGEEIAVAAEDLLNRLSPADVARRVQLATWAAHHRHNQGDGALAEHLLDSIDQLARADGAPRWRSLVLSVRAQGAFTAHGSKSRARAAMRDLRGWARLTADESALAGQATLDFADAMTFGGLPEVRAARARLLMLSRRMPRPDLRWIPAAVDAALALATGSPDAARLIDHAEHLGRSLHAAGAGPLSLAQRTFLMHASGELGAIAGFLEPKKAHANPLTVALWGLACLEAGDLDGAGRAAAELSARTRLLPATGIAWSVMAMAASEIAAELRCRDLAMSVWDDLRPWSGTGLNLQGLLYLGAADASLSRLAHALGQPAMARRLAQAALDQETTRGATRWAERAEALVRSQAVPTK